ncbi:MAG: membrane-bound alpha-1,6- mannosyltransferase Initiation-specific [Lichina confinis]|nr:MAG: membrane-bound alpha-1,6- mannosyltransferase Initiation-specific [Lichina confinis]
MISLRRALLVAALVLTCLYLLRPSTSSASSGSSAFAIEKGIAGSAVKDAPDGATTGRTNYNPTSSWRSKLKDDGKHPKQQALVGVGAGSLKDQLAYRFPYDVEAKFPAYIWQTWKDTPASGKFPEQLRPKEASWTEKHPGFVHEVITDRAAVPLIRHLYSAVPTVVEAYEALPLPILKADFFRYLILLARGGIYSDIDTSALRPAFEWVPDRVPRTSFGLVIGIEADPDRPDWQQWYSRRIQFCQWTIQAKPGHPVLADIVAKITEETLRRKKAGTLEAAGKSVIEFTGPALWTDKIFEYFNDEEHFDLGSGSGNISWIKFTGMTETKQVGDVIVLPITSFSPGVGQMNAGEIDDPMAFVHHDFQGIWKPEEERNIRPSQ